MRTPWSLLLAAAVLGSLGSVSPGHGAKPLATARDPDEVNAVAFSPDGKTLFSGSGQADGRSHGRVAGWEAATGKPLNRGVRLAFAVSAVAVSPDGQLLAVSTRGTLQGPANRPFRCEPGDLKLFDPVSGTLKASLKSSLHSFSCLAFSPDGKTLAAGSSPWTDRGQQLPGGVIRLWDVARGKETATLKGHRGIVQGVAFAPDGKTLASVSYEVPPNPNLQGEGEVKLWDLTTAKEKMVLGDRHRPVWCVAFSPDGKLLASGGEDGLVRLWDPLTGKEVAALKGHQAAVVALAFSPDGATLASAGGNPGVYPSPGDLRLWDPARRKEKAVLPGHQVTVMAVAFDPSGRRLASGDKDGVLKLWDVSGPGGS
jgi:WD40 repeat protein